jgi:GNAT superfamily N-acetyltransferase
LSTPERHIARLKPDEPRPCFDCGDSDLNDYFLVDSVKACKDLVAVTYVLREGDKVIAYYCVSNDAIRSDLSSVTAFKKLQKHIIHPEKRYSSLPAVKIGRLGVSKDYARQNIGSQLMSAIKYDFINGNKTGCRFIIVDAYKDPRVINFYEKNGFKFLSGKDEKKDTRLMVYDLIQYANTSEEI